MFGPECFLQNIVDNLDICSKALQEWNTVQRGALKRMIKVKKHEFQMANDVSNFDEWQVLNKIERELDNLLVTEEKYWRQRSQRPAACVSRFERWIPPNEGFVKVNFDAAIDISRGVVSLGWVVHDSEGFVLLSAVKPVMGGFSPEVAEALAVLTALQVARDFCFNRILGVGVCRIPGGELQSYRCFVRKLQSYRSFVPLTYLTRAPLLSRLRRAWLSDSGLDMARGTGNPPRTSFGRATAIDFFFSFSRRCFIAFYEEGIEIFILNIDVSAKASLTSEIRDKKRVPISSLKPCRAHV
ncbi:hypothetical protein ACOSQ4_021483 [Xanthoceras sorbifolium]